MKDSPDAFQLSYQERSEFDRLKLADVANGLRIAELTAEVERRDRMLVSAAKASGEHSAALARLTSAIRATAERLRARNMPTAADRLLAEAGLE